MIKRKLSSVWKRLLPNDKKAPDQSPSGRMISPKLETNNNNNNNTKESPRVLYANTVAELPEDIKQKIEKSALPEQTLNEHFPILANILRFTMKKQIRYDKEKFSEKEVNEPSSPPTRPRDTSQLPDHFQKASQSTTHYYNPKTDYQKKKFLGKGGFGQVWLATKQISSSSKKETNTESDEDIINSNNNSDDKLVVMKKMNHSTKKEKRMNTDEVNVLAKLNGNPNICSYICSYIWNDEIAIIMEYIQGGSLSQAVKKYDLSEDSISYICSEMLKGIAHLHSYGVIHRDVKSANVMLGFNGDIKLIDFGLSCDEEKASTHMVGSPFWMSPEMIFAKRHSYPADVWSFGICCIEMRDKKPPDRNSRIRCMFNYATSGVTPVIDKRLKQKKISPEFHSFISICCKLEPTERPTPKQLLKESFLKSKFDKTAMSQLVKEIFENNTGTEESEE